MIQQNRYQINIQPQNIQFEVELEQNAIIKEIFEVLQAQTKQLQIQNESIQGDINQWTCLSVQRQKYLLINEEIGNFQNETLKINTQPQQQNKLQQLQEIKNIHLKIEIQDGSIDRVLDVIFKTNNTIEDIAKTVQSYCSIEATENVTAAVDIFIFRQPYNDEIKRQTTLHLLQIKEDTTVQAKIRWKGG